MLVPLMVCAVVVMSVARELDPGACASRFDVQRDKIIRTEESREMGARYLSELDVGSRHECRRLCCETDSCDVFVYEEKSPGSCYLFNCGPPEDFRCKFTAHGNFSSGVLALSRRLAELQDQERLSPPAPPAPPAPAPPVPAPAPPPPLTTTTTTPSPPPPRPVVTAPPLPVALAPHTTAKPQSHCSRYQWECHTGGECIAVYNACDGIPQCADGSDEAPELGCPAAPVPAAPAPRPTPRTSPRPPLRPEPPEIPIQPPYPVQMYDQETNDPGPVSAETAGEQRWPHRLLQAQPRRFPGPETGEGAGPHIFSHKGGLMQEAAMPAFEPPAPAQPAWPRRPWPQHQSIENNWGGWGRSDWADERRPWLAAPQTGPNVPPQTPEMPSYLSPKTMPELPELYSEQHSLRDGPKKGLGLQPAPAPAPAAPPAPPARPADNITKKKAAPVKVESPVAADTRPKPPAPVAVEPAAAAGGVAASGGGDVTVVQAQRDEHDGLSEHPPAAVMLLVLGVTMTGVMGAMVGCRARAARRRMRRGKPFAHDADYLVNGMYL